MTDPVSLPITSLTAALLALLLLALTATVIRTRRSLKVSMGDGGAPKLRRAIAAHSNLTQYAPLFVVLLALAELQSGSGLLLGLIAAVFTLGRFLHGWAFVLNDTNMAGRVGGMVMTLTSTTAMALWVVAAGLF